MTLQTTPGALDGTPIDLEAIKARLNRCYERDPQWRDVIDLLAEVHRLRALCQPDAQRPEVEKDLVFLRFLKEESNAAHQVLDNAGIPTTKRVFDRTGGGGQQDVTIGLAERVSRLRWKSGPTEEQIIDHVAAHWFTQGGEAQFGKIDGANPDEIVSSILSVVRKQQPAGQPDASLGAGWREFATDLFNMVLADFEWVRAQGGRHSVCPLCHATCERDGGPGHLDDCPRFELARRFDACNGLPAPPDVSTGEKS